MSILDSFPELERTRLLVRCAQLYYGLAPGMKKELRQSDVARRLGVPRSQVVLWLKEVRGRFLEIRLRVPCALEMELPLEEALRPWGIRKVRVVIDGGLTEEGAIESVGAEAGRCLQSALTPGMLVGLAGGRTLLAAVKELVRGPIPPDLDLFPLAAGGSLPVSANALVAMLAGAAGPGAKASGLWVPPLRPGRGRRDLREFLGRPPVREVYRAAQKVDIALLGIGATAGPGGIRGMCEYLGATEGAARRMAKTPARAFILQQFIDGQGEDYPCPLGEMNLAVPLDTIRRMAAQYPRRQVILAAAGAAKSRAVVAAIRGRLATTFVMDTEIAGDLLKEFCT